MRLIYWALAFAFLAMGMTLAARADILTPTSTLTRPANTTAYAQNDLIASNATAGSVVVPSVLVRTSQGVIGRLRLTTDVVTGWGAATVRVRLWTAAPTYTNGDNGAYAVATGAAGYIGTCDVTLEQDADGARGDCSPTVGAAFVFNGVKLFWDLQDTTAAALTPKTGQVFTLTAEILR